MTAWAKICELLPSLSADELQDIKVRVSAFQNLVGGSAISVHSDTDVDLVLEAIVRTMRGLGLPIGGGALRRSPAYRGFCDKAPLIMQFVRSAARDRTEQRVFLAIGFAALYQDLNWMRIPVTGRVLMQHAHNMPASIEKRFPSYAKNGMLSWIIQKEASNYERYQSRRRSDARS